jgi:hypothetical protein
MISVDTNILVYAHRQDSAFHAKADELLTELAEGRREWSIAWPCIHEFLAIAGRMEGSRIHDARIPAICLANGIDELWTADRDFSRLSGLKIANPLL